MIFAVIDTNVIVSAALASDRNDSIPFAILKEALTGKIIPVISDEMMQEYTEVLLRPKFNLEPIRVKKLLDGLQKRAVSISIDNITCILPDCDDTCFYKTLLATSSLNSILITGNLKHFPKISSIMSPTEFYLTFLLK